MAQWPGGLVWALISDYSGSHMIAYVDWEGLQGSQTSTLI